MIVVWDIVRTLVLCGGISRKLVKMVWRESHCLGRIPWNILNCAKHIVVDKYANTQLCTTTRECILSEIYC